MSRCISARVALRVALVVVLAGGTARAAVLCPFVDPGTPFVHVEVDPSSPVFVAYGDAYEGGVAWQASDRIARYDVTAEIGTEPLPPAEIKARLVALVAALVESPAFRGAAEDNRVFLRRAMKANLETLARAVAELEGETLVRWDVLRDAGGALVTFDQTSVAPVAGERCASGTYSSNSAFFAAPDPAETVVLRADRLVQSGPLGVSAVDPTQAIYIATLDQAIEYRAVVAQVQKLFAAQRGVAVNHAAMRLTEINAAWSNYLEKGYSQYPWESLFNSWAPDFTWDSPPKWQLVLVHPEVSAVIDARSAQGSSLEGALLVHGLGYIRYFSEDRGWFVGLSATASITTGSDVGWGGGGTLHFGHAAIHSRVPHVSVSVLFHDTTTGSSGPFIGISVDLWRLFEKDGAQRLFQGALEN